MKTIIAILFSAITFFQPINEDIKLKRVNFLDKIFKTLEIHIANPEWLEDESFIAFKEKMYANETLSLDDQDFYSVFNQGRKNLSFTHFQLLPKKQAESSAKKSNTAPQPKAISWEELNPQTAYLKVRTFSVSGAPMMKTVQEIGTDKYENLIIDLRGNTGGALDAPVILGQFLTQETIDAGYYLTRKWFDNKDSLPSLNEVNQMPFLQDFTYTGIRKMYENEAAFRTVIPGHNRPIYSGKVYVLIDFMTASACEPLIDLLKKRSIATLVGERSNGAMLSGHSYKINDEFDAFIPIADYYTADGVKIDKVGIHPDIEVHPSKAKEYVLSLIEEKK